MTYRPKHRLYVPPTRPWLLTYRNVRVDEHEDSWILFDYMWNHWGKHPSVDAIVRATLYDLAGGGGWDDVCEYCPKQRYEHKNADHYFVSEEK